MWVHSLRLEDPREKEMVTHRNILGWKIPKKQEPGGLQFTRSQRLKHD